MHNRRSSNNSGSSLIDYNFSLNIICLSNLEQVAKTLAENISSQKIDVNGLYINNIDNTQYIVFPRWPNCSKILPNTVVCDSIIVSVDSIEDYEKIESYVISKESVHTIVFWTNCEDLKNKASEQKNAKFFKKSECDISELRTFILNETKIYSQTIKNIFDALDLNKNGFLEKKEIITFAREKGDNVSSQEFLDTLNLIDRHGLGKICYEDFEKWWKMGQHKSSIFGRLVQLNEISKDMMISDEKLQLLKSDLIKSKVGKHDSSSHLIKISSEEKFENPGFQLFVNCLVGGLEKTRALNMHLERFNEEIISNKKIGKTWFQIIISVDPNEEKKVYSSVKFLKNTLMEILERHNREVVSFIRSLFNIEEKVIGNQVVITFKIKIDLQNFFENALLPILQFFDLFTCSQESTSQILLDFQTKLKLSEIFEKNLTLRDALKSYLLEFKANMLRGHLRNIVHSYKNINVHSWSEFFWNLTAPDTLDLNCNMEIENLLSEEKLNTKLGFLGEIISFYLNEYELIIPFIRKITQVSFSLNFNKLFFDFRVKLR